MSDLDHIRVIIDGSASDLRRATREAVRDIRDVAQEVRRASAETKASNVQTDRAGHSYRNLGVEVRGTAQHLRNFNVGLRAIAWGTAIANTAPLAAGLADIGAGAVAAGAALAPLAGSVAALPGLFAAGAQGAGVLALATHGLGKAMAGNAQALKELTPAARNFVKTLRSDFGPEIRKLQATAQAGLFPSLERGVKALVPALRPLNKIVADTAKRLGGLASAAGHMVASKAWQKDIATLGARNGKVITSLGTAGLLLADSMRNITIAAGPMVDWMARSTREAAATFDQWTKGARASGKLGEFFDLTRQRISQTVAVVKNLGTTLFNVFSAANPLGGALLQGLVGATKHLADLTSSVQGKNALGDFFANAKAPLEAVGKLIGALGAALADLAGQGQAPLKQLADTLRVDVLPVLHGVLSAIATEVLPHVIELLGSVGRLAQAILPGLGPIIAALGHILDLVAKILDHITQMTEGLPGVAKLIPTLAVAGTVLASWRTLVALSRAVVFGNVAAGLTGAGAAGAAAGAGAASARNFAAVTAATAGGGAGFLARGGLKGLATRALPKIASRAPLIGGVTATGDALLNPDAAGITKANGALDKLIASYTRGKTGVREYAKGLQQLADRLHEQAFEASPKAAAALHAQEDAVRRQVAPIHAVIGAIDKLKGSTATDMQTIATSVRLNMKLVARSMTDGSEQSKQALSQNFQAGAQAIRTSMKAGLISTKDGLRKINEYFRKDLALYGITGKNATNYLSNSTGDLSGKGSAGTSGSGQGLAVGGYIGAPGESGADDVPVVLGRGEAVLNRHQQGPVNAALQAVYGTDLGGIFQSVTTPHYMAKGGFAGMVAKANAIDARQYNYEWGGGHDGAFSPSHGSGHGSGPGIGYDCSGAVSAVLHAGGVLTAPRTSGALMSYGKPGAGKVTIFANAGHTYMRLGGRYFGTSNANPGGGAGWFAGSPRAGFAVRHVDATGGANIPRVHFPGGMGALSALGQGALDKVRGAANHALSGIAFGGSVGGGDPAEATPATGGGWKQCLLTYYRPSSGGINGREGGGAWAGHPVYDTTWGCAAPSGYAFGTRITFAYGGKTVTVPVVDRGSAITGSHFDLLPGPARQLGLPGKASAKFKVAGRASSPLGGAHRLARGGIAKAMARGGFVGRRMASGGYVASAASVGDSIIGLGQPDSSSGTKTRRKRKRSSSASKPVSGVNPNNGRVEYHTPAVWHTIRVAYQRKRYLKAHQPKIAKTGSGNIPGEPDSRLPSYTDSTPNGGEDLTRPEQQLLEFFDGHLAMADVDTPFVAYDPSDTTDKPFDPASGLPALHNPANLDDDLLWSGRKVWFTDTIYGDRKKRGATAPVLGRIAQMVKSAHADYDALKKLHDTDQRGAYEASVGQGLADARLPLITSQRDDALRNLALSNQQFGVLSGIAPLIAGRFAGSFARGTMSVPHDGLAMVHQGEAILPNPKGQFGNQITAPQTPVSPQIDVTVNVDHRGMVQSVEAMVDGKIVRAQQNQGRRARLIASTAGVR